MFKNYRDHYLRYFKQFFAVITGSIGLISNGMEYGWAGPAIPKLAEIDSPIPIDLEDSNVVDLLQILYMLGSIFGMPLSFFLFQYLGRKKGLLIAQSFSFVSWILVATSTSIEQLYVARFFSGFGANAMFVGLPMYSAEVSEPPIRGFLGSALYLMSMFGVLVSYAVVPYIPIFASALLSAGISLTMLVSFSFQPESPYFLLIKNRNEEAESCLKRLRYNRAEVPIEMREISTAVERQQSERGHILDLIRIKSNRKATLIMMFLNTAQNLSGVTVLVMNAQLLLREASELGGVPSPLSDEISAVTFAVTMLVSCILGAIMIDKYGRRVLIIGSSGLSAIFLAILSVYFYNAEFFANAGLTWIPLFSLIAYAFSFKCGLGLVPIVITAELFSTSVKSIGMVLADLWFTVLATISLQIYHATNYLGTHVPFAFFAICAALTTIIVSLYVPETKGKTLEEIQMMLKGKSNDETVNIKL